MPPARASLREVPRAAVAATSLPHTHKPGRPKPPHPTAQHLDLGTDFRQECPDNASGTAANHTSAGGAAGRGVAGSRRPWLVLSAAAALLAGLAVLA